MDFVFLFLKRKVEIVGKTKSFWGSHQRKTMHLLRPLS